MSVNYSLALMSSKPGNKSAAKLYYAKAQANGEITMAKWPKILPTPHP